MGEAARLVILRQETGDSIKKAPQVKTQRKEPEQNAQKIKESIINK